MHRVQTMFEALVASENKRAKVKITVSVFDGDEQRLHQTFRLKKWINGGGEIIVTVDLDDGSYTAGTFPTKVVHANLTRGDTFPAKGTTDALLIYAAKAALTFARTGELPSPSNGRVEATEASLCGHCGATLTDPVSIERGIGPDCFGKETGTTTIRSRPKVEHVTRTPPPVEPLSTSHGEAVDHARSGSQLQELPGTTWEDIFKAS